MVVLFQIQPVAVGNRRIMHRCKFLLVLVIVLSFADSVRHSSSHLQDQERPLLVDASSADRNFGRHICSKLENVSKPVKTKHAYCKPTYKKYFTNCNGQLCAGVRLVYERHYKDVITTKNSNELIYSCCPGWGRIMNTSQNCNKPLCTKPCLNGGKCIKPNTCSCTQGFSGFFCQTSTSCTKICLNGGKCNQNVCTCRSGFAGEHCEFHLGKNLCLNNATFLNGICKCTAGFQGKYCEVDVDECKEWKPCDHICLNTHGSFKCDCKEDFLLQADGQSCRSELADEGTLETKDMELDLIDKRLLKLETLMDESHKNDVSKNDLTNIFSNMGYLSKDIGFLKSKIVDIENYKSDMHKLVNKMSQVERKANKVDELSLKYDKMKRCAFYNKICI